MNYETMSDEVWNYLGEIEFKKWMANPYAIATDHLELLDDPDTRNDPELYEWLLSRKQWAIEIITNAAAQN